MPFYRSFIVSNNSGGGGVIDYSATYTATVNGVLHNGSCNGLFNALQSDVPFSNFIVGNKVDDLSYMFYACNANHNVYIKGTTYRDINCRGMFTLSNSSFRQNVYFNSVLNNCFNKTNVYSIRGAAITWQTMTNGFYNSLYNFYCYYNYEG